MRKSLKYFLIGFGLLLIIVNAIAFAHAYKFTHFDQAIERTRGDQSLSFKEKVKIIFLGINNPRPENESIPDRNYQVITLTGNQTIETWFIKADSSKGTIILFHGYGGDKSRMLDKADIFLGIGYNCLLVDFMGSGGSEGNQTTIGFYEAEQVKSSLEYLESQGEKNIVLFGTSMGAVAIMKAMNDYSLKVSSIMLECPYGTMLQTVKARFNALNVPTFPMANLLVFWGGVINNFNAFELQPVNYARAITCPTLLMYGELDKKVSRKEIDQIFKNLNGRKSLKTYPQAGHENYLNKYKGEWTSDIKQFLKL